MCVCVCVHVYVYADMYMQIQAVLFPKISKKKMPSFDEAIIKASATCEFLLPGQWCTITKHSLLHVFGLCGRIARYGALSAIRMMGVERFNKFLRGLMHARKHIELTVATGYQRYRMICSQRRSRPPQYFILQPEMSTAISYAGGYGRDWSTPPDHLRPMKAGWQGRLLGAPKSYVLSENERIGLTATLKKHNTQFGDAFKGK
jgi:hypothetical protein